MPFASAYAPIIRFGGFSGDVVTVIVMMLMLLAVLAVMLVVFVALYIIGSLVLYVISKRRGIRNPWLSWLPVGNMWILGSISDQYQKLAKNNDTGRRKLLVGLTVSAVVLVFAVEIFTVLSGPVPGLSDGSVLFFEIVAFFTELAYLIVWTISLVLQYKAYFDLYRSCSPQWAILYLLLSIFAAPAMPVLLLLCMKKDDGLPKKEV